ncbi:AraC family transcriptional regulator [Congregibacter brevis]|uniref:AraC family transcriptional regulator n=1 Tax=Congregibacter brevis TaxID=3081201 RepID=A0ABZ0IFD9_9GAMM|nr:AraC family transcriptional regulator [Congregibacter sp. IMCC45268]
MEARELNSYVRHTLRVLEDQGVDVRPLIESFGIDAAALESQEDQLSQSDYGRLVDAIVAQYPDLGLGLRDGRGVTLLDHGLLGYAMFASQNLGKAIERHSKYQDVIGAALQTRLFVEDELACLRVVCIVRPELVNTPAKLHYETERLLAQWAEIGPAFGESRHWFTRIDLDYSAPGYLDLYSEVLGPEVHFGREHTQIVFPHRLLDQALNFANEQAAALCEQQCAALLGEMQAVQGFTGQVRRLLANAPGHHPSIEEAASKLAMSERSLRRRLAEEGTTYKEVVLDFRMELASSYLRGQEMSIQEVAFLAGYADASNFHRTFSRYFGATPGEFRSAKQGPAAADL